MKLVHCPLMGGLLHLVQRGGTERGLAVQNVIARPSTASVPTTVLLCNGPLLCGFNVAIKELRSVSRWPSLLTSYDVNKKLS